jgi:ankyrin repeat protein
LEAVVLLIRNKGDVNLADQEGNTPLMAAATRGDAALAARLIQSGAAAEAQNSAGKNALQIAEEAHPKNTRLIETLKKAFKPK